MSVLQTFKPGIVPALQSLLRGNALRERLLQAALLLAGGATVVLTCPTGAAAQEGNYREWLERQQGEYRQFLSEQDEAFLTFLEKEWTTVSVDRVAEVSVDGKPRRAPSVELDIPDRSSARSSSGAPFPSQNPAAAPNSNSEPQSDSGSQKSPAEQGFSLQADSSFQGPDNKGEKSQALGSQASGNAGQTPASMEEAMEDLESATDNSEPASGGAPNSEAQASKRETGEKQPNRRTAPESSDPENPSSESSFPASPSPEQASREASAGEIPKEASEEISGAVSLSQEASLSFFGVSTAVPYGPDLATRLEGAPGKSSIRRFWKTMAEGPYRPTLAVLRKQRKDMNLGDWGYYLYLRRFSRQLYGDGSGSVDGSRAASERVLWTWFMMMKSGYAARVGYQEGEAILMLPIDQKVFGRPQMHIGGQRYYLMGEEVGGSLRTYEGQHGEASRALQLGEGLLPDMPEESAERTVEFSFQGERHSLDIAYNPSAAEYLRAYPKVGLGVLFSAGMSPEARSSLKESLRPLIRDRPPRESLNLLLKFAQFATGYKRDQEHFGEERFLFPEETLASDYSDCEDRAVLLGYLAGELLGRKVVGLQWPSHVALAVRAGDGLTATAEDHTVTAGGETYIYADPTYLGSSAGMEMPPIEGKTPEIISLAD